MSEAAAYLPIDLPHDIIVIVGGYGSGKSEVAVNLAKHLVASGSKPVALADLDIVNPYFRSREAAEMLKKLGVTPLVPEGEQAQADLPIIIPQIKGAIQANQGWLILDVGGDDAGATVLSSLANAFVPGTYDLLLTLNAFRPFTADLAGTRKVMGEIEKAGKLKFTGLIANSHLIELTTPKDIEHGIDLARQVSKDADLPVRFVSVENSILDKMEPSQIPHPVLAINRSLLKPWERNSTATG